MQLCRFDNDRLGLVEDDAVRGVTAALDILPRHGYPLPRHDPLVANLAALRPQIESVAAGAPRRPLAGLMLLSPIANPGKILAALHGGGGPRGCLVPFQLLMPTQLFLQGTIVRARRAVGTWRNKLERH